MRTRRQKLEVSTFPFLAVLLCAMGSLMLVLLVVDRKAKQAALAKALADRRGGPSLTWQGASGRSLGRS